VRRALVGTMLVSLMLFVPASGSAAVTAGTITYSDAFGGTGIFTALPDASGRTHLADTTGALRPAWSPDGMGIAFAARNDAIRWVDADGSNGHALVPASAWPAGWTHIEDFAWSPDASQLVVGLFRQDYSTSRLFLVTLAGPSVAPLVRNASSPDWSSTEQLVAVRDGGLITMDTDGSNQLVIVGSSGNYDPQWSPNGGQVAYRGGKRNLDIFVVDANGSNRTNLTNSPQTDWSPTWSPDGGTIMWSRSRYLDSFADLFTMLANGSNVTRLTHTDKIDEYEPDWTA
jgi:Tol biopolymer transport system component